MVSTVLYKVVVGDYRARHLIVSKKKKKEKKKGVINHKRKRTDFLA